MNSNFWMNSDKTEVILVILIEPEHLQSQLSCDIVSLEGIALLSVSTVKHLGVLFDRDVSFNSLIKQTSRTAFFLST